MASLVLLPRLIKGISTAAPSQAVCFSNTPKTRFFRIFAHCLYQIAGSSALNGLSNSNQISNHFVNAFSPFQSSLSSSSSSSSLPTSYARREPAHGRPSRFARDESELDDDESGVEQEEELLHFTRRAPASHPYHHHQHHGHHHSHAHAGLSPVRIRDDSYSPEIERRPLPRILPYVQRCGALREPTI